MINLGNKIRELRVNKGLTQEQLATALNLSPQAISKWETGGGYPDVATLPVLAGYFGVSLDEMFEYDPEEVEEKIQNALVKSRVEVHGWENTVNFLQESIAAYPGGHILKLELLEHYTWHLTDKGTDLTEEALDLAKQIVAECPDSFITLAAKGSMARIYIEIGQYEKGKAIIESMPYRYHLDLNDRMRCTAMYLNSQDAMHETREWKRWAHQELYMVCEAEAKCFYDTGDYENALLSYEEAADLLERFWRREIPREYALLQGPDIPRGLTMVNIAACLYRLGRIEECDATLDRAYRMIREAYSDESWETCKDIRIAEYRKWYDRMGLNEYKPWPY